ncbi:MAG TPA: hypothetical protein PKM54_16935 [Anaerolineales bacterium]|nr:hypothetical protein [Anaerolineales bacterium]
MNNQLNLSRILLANGVFCSTSGLIFLLAAKPLSEFLNTVPVVMSVLGIGLIAYGAWVNYMATRRLITNFFSLFVIGADLLSDTLKHLDRLASIPQNHEIATFAPIMRKENGLINWNLSATQISNQVRGFQPFPTSYSFYQGKKLTIWKAKVSKLERDEIPVGDILHAKGDLLLVSCGENSMLQIEELQLEGKNRMKTRDFLNGVKMQMGEHLG